MSKRRSCKTQTETARNRRSVQNCKNGQSKDAAEDNVNTPLLLDDVTCKICMDIMLEPVTMPCEHQLCFPCFESCVQKANLSCPMCRKRISVWIRQATKNKTLINEKLWLKIQATFPERIQARREGQGQDPDEYVPTVPMHQFARPGEILQEFEKERQRLLEEEEKRRRDEEIASAHLIAELEAQQEVERVRAAEMERILKEDEALAVMLSSPSLDPNSREVQTVDRTPNTSTGRKRPRKSPAEGASSSKRSITNFFTSGQECTRRTDSEPSSFSAFSSVHSTGSSKDTTDESITIQGLSVFGSGSSTTDGRTSDSGKLHFRPIKAAPLTPTKDSLDAGKIFKPQAVNLLEKFQSVDDGVSPGDINQNVAGSSSDDALNGSLADELMAMERQWLTQKLQQEEADLELARQLQKQMDDEVRQRSVVNRAKGTHDQYQLRPSVSTSRKQVTIQDAFQKNPSTRRSTSGKNFPEANL